MQNTPAIQPRVLFAACFGVFVEWYDFLTFGTLAATFGILFFPADNPTAGLLASLATFGAGMIVRPLGAAMFGPFADTHGRRPTFIITLVLMGFATLGVGVLPVYESWGLFAPALLMLLRLIQGFAMGGEVGGVAVYLTEHAAAGKRGLYTSVLQLMGPLGIMASGLQLVLLRTYLSNEQFMDWGWRVPFLFSALLMVVFLWMRMSLEESPVFIQLQENKHVARTPLQDCLRDPRTLGRMALLFFCISAGGSLLFFTSQVYSSVFLKNVVRLDDVSASWLVTLSTIVLIPLTIAAGWLSDRIGRRPVLLAGLLLGAASILPVYGGLLHIGNPALERFNREIPVVIHGNACDYSPFTKPRNDCERNQELLTRLGVSHIVLPTVAGESQRVEIAGIEVPRFQPEVLTIALRENGWQVTATPSRQAQWLLALLLLIPAIAVALITGPQTAVLAELFTARTRYTAAALPHNLSAGWIGGLSPFIVTLISVHMGNIMAGLWYLTTLLVIAFVIGYFFLPETRDADLGD